MPKKPAEPAKRRKSTRTWEDENTGWNYEVTHPDGHSASGAYFETREKAKAAAKKATFA